MIQIRQTILQDAELLHSIQKEAFFPLYERYHDAGNPYLRGIEDISMRLAHPGFRYFTILSDGEIVGGVMYKISGRTPFYDPMPRGMVYLSRIYVKPGLQGRGIARRAILLCEGEFPEAELFSVDFPEDLERNRRCYEAAGFHDTGDRLETDPGVILASYLK
ncbi:MAG: GNAT family N-acetyltransferase [Ruminococcaceae bacterium]|nr:GNAT family N-acetyltransferase [Oscillospiraceae bacterium]